MELRFFAGYIVGIGLLAFLNFYDFEWYVMLAISIIVYAGTQSLAHKWFDK